MLEITSCPDCDKKLKLPDNLVGKKVRCPGCRVMFTARPDSDEDEEATVRAASRSTSRNDGYSKRRSARDDYDDRPRRRDDYDDYDRRPRRSDLVKGWRGTRMGISLVVVSNWIYLAGLGVCVLAAGVSLLAGASMFGSAVSFERPGFGFRGYAAGIYLMFSLVGLLFLASAILQLVGQGMCIQVPTRRSSSGPRIMAIIAFVCACLAFLLDTGNFFVGYGWGGHGLGGYSMGSLVRLASFILWLVFLRLVAQECRDPDLAGRLMALLIGAVVVVAMAWVLLSIAYFAMAGAFYGMFFSGSFRTASALGILVMVLLLVVFLAYVGILVWFGLLMQQVRDLVGRHLSRL